MAALQRFFAGQTHLSPRDKLEVDCHPQILLQISDQQLPDQLARLDATNTIILRIMALCLQTKQDSGFLEVFSNLFPGTIIMTTEPAGQLSSDETSIASKVFATQEFSLKLSFESQQKLIH